MSEKREKMEKEWALQGCTFSILGDSYSTFKGFIPAEYRCYYPKPENVADVLKVEDTWWHRLSADLNMRLFVNNSFSGSTVCTIVREELPKESAFVHRAQLPFTGPQGEHSDFIIVYGCTNDFWLRRTIGDVQYEKWTESDLEKVLPALCYVLDTIKRMNPNSRLVIVINGFLDSHLRKGMNVAGEHYGAITVEVEDIEKAKGHPNALGMQQIALQIEQALIRAMRVGV